MDTPQRSAIALLVEEAGKRSQARWSVRPGLAPDNASAGTRIVAARRDQIPALLPSDMTGRLQDCHALDRDEGYSVQVLRDGAVRWIIVTGHDDRGMLFGLGYLLRKTDWAALRVGGALGFACVVPAVPVRGHQLGYRFKNNTYDGWTIAQFEQYIRDLAIFGTNTIELLPPITDDAPDSALFPQPALATLVGVSGLLQQYGLRCSVFYPALAADYRDPATVTRELDAWDDVLRRLPQLDELFVPGGDPGHTDPEVLFGFLAKLATRLHLHHPNATIWVSTQGFDAAQLETFYRLVVSGQVPAWLTGVVFGPQSRDPVVTQRARIPSHLPLRLYPDIAHTYHSQFPVPQWDPVFALTEGREPINPQPAAQTRIFHAFAPPATAFVTYSEGVNDDVNKFIWTALGVDPTARPEETLADYARWFISHDLGPRLATRFATGLAALERNWAGPIASNSSIQPTLKLFQQIEARAPQAVQRNWRIQLALYRAWFDAYEQLRAAGGAQRERAALNALTLADHGGTSAALDAAEKSLNATAVALKQPTAIGLPVMRTHIEALASALFDSIRLQLSVTRFHASAVDRGANLDTLDASLNDRVWLEQRFQAIRALPDEAQRLAAVHAIVHYEHPVPGAYYDDLGEPGHEPHLVRAPQAADPDLRHSPHDGIADIHPDAGWRRSWVTYAGSLYDEPLVLAYEHLDPNTRYRLRITYAGEDYTLPMRLIANDAIELHPPRKRLTNPETVDFDLPPAATRTGKLKLTWTRPPGVGGGGRGAQVAEVWLLPVTRPR